jgi:uncharacterized protein (TIGR03084 family)
MAAICRDLAAEHAALDDIVAPLPADAWDTPTPAPGWAVRDQIAHLAFFDRTAARSATDPEGFVADLAALQDPTALQRYVDEPMAAARAMSSAELLAWWREGRQALLAAFSPLDPKARLPWYGPAMSAMSFATARLMETWAHGQDVADALGVTREPTDRLRHVAHIGVGARRFSYATRGLDMPDGDIRVELTGPGGDRWTWGPEGAADRVVGDALDFCLAVTQRRHPSDTNLEVEGPLASEWIAIAQAFAGPPGEGRKPGQFA